MKLQRFGWVLFVVLAMLLAACGGAPEDAGGEATGETGGETAGAFRVAVVLPSPRDDRAFSQSMYDALVRVQEEMGAENFEFAYSENLGAPDDAAAAVRNYASQGYDLVIAHGSQYGGVLVEIAREFPDTSFAHGTTVQTFADEGVTNVFAYEARSEQGGYVNGVMAAMLSESNTIGVIGPVDTGDAALYVDGFVAGVSATEPETQVLENWTNDFGNTSLAAEAANTHISAGADVLTGTAQMVVGAMGVANEQGIEWFGTQSNQTDIAPNIVVASQVYHWEDVLTQIIDLVKGGTLGGQAFAIDLANGGLVIEYNDGYPLPEDVRAAADAAVAGIQDGSITVALPAAP